MGQNGPTGQAFEPPPCNDLNTDHKNTESMKEKGRDVIVMKTSSYDSRETRVQVVNKAVHDSVTFLCCCSSFFFFCHLVTMVTLYFGISACAPCKNRVNHAGRLVRINISFD